MEYAALILVAYGFFTAGYSYGRSRERRLRKQINDADYNRQNNQN